MDITDAIETLKKHSVNDDVIKEIKDSAAKLPSSFISLKIKGFDSNTSLPLVSRLMRIFSAEHNIKLPHTDAIGLSNISVKYSTESEIVKSAIDKAVKEANDEA